MNSPEIAIPAGAPTAQESSLNSNLRMKQQAKNKADFKRTKSAGESKVPTPFDSAIHYELRKPLDRINLSIEMLKSEIKDQDLNIYLDIILRGSIHIKKIIDEVYLYQPTDRARHENSPA